MKKRMVVAVLAVLATGSRAQAAGVAVGSHGARATGMALAVAAGIDDASAAFYNPAGLALIDGLELQLGDTMLLPRLGAEVPRGGEVKIDAVPVFPPHLYAGYEVVDNVVLGVGFFAPFGLAVHWPDGWAGQALSQDAELQTYFANPEIAVAVLDRRLRLAAGFQAVWAEVDLSRAVSLPGGINGGSRLVGDDIGFGANAGIQFDVLPKWLTLGASYRSPVALTFEGSNDVSGPGPLATALDRDATASFDLPQILALGVASRPLDGLWVEFDVEYFGWQTLQELRVEFEGQPAIPPSVEKKLWEHTWNYHLGAEYELVPKLRVRAGIEIDPTPQPAETLAPNIPDSDRWNLTAGAGYQFGKVMADLGYQYVNFTKQTSTLRFFPATYFGSVHIVGLTLGVKI